jgi:hypothetical protein
MDMTKKESRPQGQKRGDNRSQTDGQYKQTDRHTLPDFADKARPRPQPRPR